MNLIAVIGLAVVICSPGHRAAGASPSASTKARSDTAAVKGTVQLEGAPPTAARMNMSSDQSCAKQHRTPISGEQIVAGKNGDLQNVVVFVAEGLGNRTFEPPPQAAVAEQKGCMYQPQVLALQTNQKVQFVNGDSTAHNVHPQPGNNREWNKAQVAGSTVEETFPREEVGIPLKCNLHPWMRSYLAVFKHAYFAVTGKDGSFDLSDLPPGTYTISAWQEKLGTATQKITVGSHQAKTLPFVFKSRTGSSGAGGGL